MPWVRYDDRYRLHRKIRPLTDRLFRLATEAIMWSASEENLTDGRIERTDLTDIRPKATTTDAAALVARDIWHRAGDPCDSTTCPPPNPGTGWRIHDYFDYQPSRAKVIADRAAKAERQRNWMARRRTSGASSDASRDGLRDAPVDATPSPPRPAPKGRAGTDVPAAPAARRAAAGRPGGGEPEDQTPIAAADPHPNGAMGVPPPPEAKAAMREAIAAARAKARGGDREGALDQLRELTPEVPPLVEPTMEASA